MKLVSSNKIYAGRHQRWQHESTTCNCTMTFSIFLPKVARYGKLPALYWLSGLTCTDENFSIKSGAQRHAAKHEMVLVIPDTSPRGEQVADSQELYYLGQGAGFYVNATEQPWQANYQMFSYITEELPSLIEDNFPVIAGMRSISGHSMGGHGALICALRRPDLYRSVSAFAPISHPSSCNWGETAFTAYLGADRNNWKQYDSWELVADGAKLPYPLLIDQGVSDDFFSDQLKSEKFATHAREHGLDIEYSLRPGYDHSYFYVSTFLRDHFHFHRKYLNG